MRLDAFGSIRMRLEVTVSNWKRLDVFGTVWNRLEQLVMGHKSKRESERAKRERKRARRGVVVSVGGVFRVFKHPNRRPVLCDNDLRRTCPGCLDTKKSLAIFSIVL